MATADSTRRVRAAADAGERTGDIASYYDAEEKAWINNGPVIPAPTLWVNFPRPEPGEPTK